MFMYILYSTEYIHDNDSEYQKKTPTLLMITVKTCDKCK